MKQRTFLSFALITLAVCLFVQFPATERVHSQGRGAVTPEVIAQRNEIENQL